MAIRVECYSGYRGEQEPLAFWLGDRRLEVRSVADRWFAPEQRWFKVDADDGNLYVLRHDEASGDWEIAAYPRIAYHVRSLTRTTPSPAGAIEACPAKQELAGMAAVLFVAWAAKGIYSHSHFSPPNYSI